MKLKDKTFMVSKIKIQKVQEHEKINSFHVFEDKLFLISVLRPTGVETSTAFPYTKKGVRRLLKFIEEEGL